jgi:hypothetical protein
MRKLCVFALIAMLANLVLEKELLACWGRLRIHICKPCQDCRGYAEMCASAPIAAYPLSGIHPLEACDAGSNATGAPCRIECPGPCYAVVIDGVCTAGCVELGTGKLPARATTGTKQIVNGLHVKNCPLKYVDALLGFQHWTLAKYDQQQLETPYTVRTTSKMTVEQIARLFHQNPTPR